MDFVKASILAACGTRKTDLFWQLKLHRFSIC